MSPEAKRAKSALVAVKKLDEAAKALNAFIVACNACNDASGDLELAGKGIDGRRKLIWSIDEYSRYLDTRYSQEYRG